MHIAATTHIFNNISINYCLGEKDKEGFFSYLMIHVLINRDDKGHVYLQEKVEICHKILLNTNGNSF